MRHSQTSEQASKTELGQLRDAITTLEIELKQLACHEKDPRMLAQRQQRLKRVKRQVAKLCSSQTSSSSDGSAALVSATEQKIFYEACQRESHHFACVIRLARQLQNWSHKALRCSNTLLLYYYLGRMKIACSKVERACSRLKSGKREWLAFAKKLARVIGDGGGPRNLSGSFAVLNYLGHLEDEIARLHTANQRKECQLTQQQDWLRQKTEEVENLSLFRLHQAMGVAKHVN